MWLNKYTVQFCNVMVQVRLTLATMLSALKVGLHEKIYFNHAWYPVDTLWFDVKLLSVIIVKRGLQKHPWQKQL